ncbi:MAG: hypothetical protein P9F19_15730 [Candidatus Contendobacter sp.]|nr:hypothetical protein [Candidatus Contendobacter sp.]MDG4558821.1 hypothetical protein [Candidatus Contendobacter sp.]
MSDTIIQEVRNIRERHAASLGYNLDRIYIDLKARQEKHAAEGWVIVPPPANPPPEPNLALQRARFARR